MIAMRLWLQGTFLKGIQVLQFKREILWVLYHVKPTRHPPLPRLQFLLHGYSMSRAIDDEAAENWQEPNRHINELQHLRQVVQMPVKYPSTTLTKNDSDARRRPKPADAAHKKSHSFFGTSPYMIASPQPLSESEAAESSFFPGNIPSTKRRTRSSSSAGYSPTPSTSSGRTPSTESPSMSFSLDKNKSWLQETSGSEHPTGSPRMDRQPAKRALKDARRKQDDKENRDPIRTSGINFDRYEILKRYNNTNPGMK